MRLRDWDSEKGRYTKQKTLKVVHSHSTEEDVARRINTNSLKWSILIGGETIHFSVSKDPGRQLRPPKEKEGNIKTRDSGGGGGLQIIGDEKLLYEPVYTTPYLVIFGTNMVSLPARYWSLRARPISTR